MSVSSEIISALARVQDLYPCGIPTNLLVQEEQTEIVLAVDYTWQTSPWEGKQGELIKAIVEKGLKLETNQVKVVSLADKVDLEALDTKMIVSFGQEVYNGTKLKNPWEQVLNQFLELGSGAKLLVTYSVQEISQAADKKKVFWEQLKKHVL